MPSEVSAVLPKTEKTPDAFEPKAVAKPRFVATFHRNSYGQSDLVGEGQGA